MKKILLFPAVLLLTTIAMAQQPIATLPVTQNKLVIIAHRGNHTQVPENTVAAIEEAIRCGADYAELDLRTTKDSQLVLMHDASVSRTTNGEGQVADMTLAELRQLKLTGANGSAYQVPTFAEVLNACKGKLNIYLDFKDADVAATWQQIKAAGMEKQVVVYLNEKEQYKPWRTIAPEVPLMCSLPEQITTPERLAYFLDNVQIAVMDNITDSAMLAVARKQGVAIWLDVQHPTEGPTDWNTALDKGVQGLQTDHPVALINYLQQNKLRNGKTTIQENR
ncbi:glycerophosphodiester phosphodiesterase family protein [Chitinophaga sp. 30R24]|uniref:glycerophosphodiester phosphodiesterase family protein n=1 Tax=Chitinophaga sp. 30R24 TaxID=3248838 RepID=UPI003B8EB640